MIGSEYKGTRVHGDDGDPDGPDSVYEMKDVNGMVDEPASMEVKDPPVDPADQEVLRGKTLGVFGPDSVLRRGVYACLMHP